METSPFLEGEQHRTSEDASERPEIAKQTSIERQVAFGGLLRSELRQRSTKILEVSSLKNSYSRKMNEQLTKMLVALWIPGEDNAIQFKQPTKASKVRKKEEKMRR